MAMLTRGALPSISRSPRRFRAGRVSCVGLSAPPRKCPPQAAVACKPVPGQAKVIPSSPVARVAGPHGKKKSPVTAMTPLPRLL